MVKLSKRLCFILRHKPSAMGITLDENGWVSVSALVAALEKHGYHISKDDIRHLVDTCNKKRFAISSDGLRIRAQYGHSVNVSIDYDIVKPPSILYHGTVERFLDSIKASGIKKGNRRLVHLSDNNETAVTVGSRRGKPFVLRVNALDMHSDGYQFYQSEAGIWLVDMVPVGYIIFPT